MAEWSELLRENAAGYARVAVDNIGREFPVGFYCLMTGPQDVPRRPRDITPVFYGSYDWHSCVEMHWLLVRLLRTAAEIHASASLPHVIGDDYMVEHWLAAYAVLLLT